MFILRFALISFFPLFLLNCGTDQEALDDAQKTRLKSFMQSLDAINEVAGDSWKDGKRSPFEPLSDKQKMKDGFLDCRNISYRDVDLVDGIPNGQAHLIIKNGTNCPVSLTREVDYRPGNGEIIVTYDYSTDHEFQQYNDITAVSWGGILDLKETKLTGKLTGTITSKAEKKARITLQYALKNRHSKRKGKLKVTVQLKGAKPFKVKADVIIGRYKNGDVKYDYKINGEEMSAGEFRRLFGWSLGLNHVVPTILWRKD